MARKYKDYPNIIYEIFNEPVDDSWETVKAYSEEVIKTIRAFDKSNVILVGSPHWSQDVHIVADNPLVGFENIMYTLHFYAAPPPSPVSARQGQLRHLKGDTDICVRMCRYGGDR